MSALLTNLCEKGIVSEMLVKLWNNGVLQLGIWETIYMTVLSAFFAYLIGLPLGMILAVTDEGGVRPVRWLNSLLGVIINFFRSIPCIILMVAMIPVARLIVHTSLGNGAVIVTLIIAAAPYVARMVESSIKEVNAGIIEAAQAMGCTNSQIVLHVLLPEAKPSLLRDHLRLYRTGRHFGRHRPGPDRYYLWPPALQRGHHLAVRGAHGGHCPADPAGGHLYRPAH